MKKCFSLFLSTIFIFQLIITANAKTVTKENEDVVEALNHSIGSKQDTITDLETIRQGAAKGATAL